MVTLADLNHPLGLRHLPLSYGQFTRLAYESFASPTTLVFLDTNVLGLPFRFHSEARKGLFSLLRVAIDEQRLLVPAWASNEFFHRAYKSTPDKHGFGGNRKLMDTLPEKSKILGILAKAASEGDLTRLAAEFSVQNHEVLAEIAGIADEWNGAINKIGADLNPEIIHAELSAELVDCFLPLDFNQHCGVVQQHADRRRANRIPPGLSDGAKGDGDKRGADVGNVDGDLALWLEILDNAQRACATSTAAQRFDCVLVLTEERKKDFSYAPITRAADPASRKPKPVVANATPQVLLADPRLVSEFQSRLAHRNLAFINVETLAHGWQAVNGGSAGGDHIRAFARALMQLVDAEPDRDGAQGGDAQGAAVQEPAAAADAGAVTVAANAGPEGASAQCDGLAIPEGAANDEKAYIDGLAALPGVSIIRALNTHNWYVQNPAVQDLMRDGVPADHGIAFLIGRALYQAAQGNAWRADNYIRKFDDWATEHSDAEQALLAGAAYEALFDGEGQRRISPKAANLHHVLEMLCKPAWSKARDWLVGAMQQSLSYYYWLPGQPYPRLAAAVQGKLSGPYFELKQIVLSAPGFADVELVKARGDDEFENGNLSVDELAEWLAEHALVPERYIAIGFKPPAEPVKIQVPKGLALDPLAFRRAVRKSG